ncbi:uncharacterized protein LOC123198887 isoform X2 [Mangifera indica]|uniref:uncharacterized protein LOC123198887 isoform X2 n=1 Tax=Mangifera indica TaxID=29780 RepID=UPI001CFA00AC|nr:uncharacterized protein LOC123198887 isoform X2 [Mangifera indica]
MMNVCQKCGDKGYLKDLIYCMQCKVSAEHRYCLDILPKSRREKVVWTCEECTPKDVKHCPVSSRKSERIIQAAEIRLNKRQVLKQTSFSKTKVHAQLGNLVEAKQPGINCFSSNDNLKRLPFYDENRFNEELRKQKRTLVLEDGENSDEESRLGEAEASPSVPTVYNGSLNTKQKRRLVLEDGENLVEESIPGEAEASPSVPTVYNGSLNTSYYLLPLDSNNDAHPQTAIGPIWRGCFNISDVNGQNIVGLVAHLTSRVCSKVLDAATALPELLTIEVVSKFDVWPQRFHKSPPTADAVALNFLPEYESDEKVIDGLLDRMIEQNLALKAVIKDMELLVFPSTDLPLDKWRLCRKYYLWGVFKLSLPNLQSVYNM